MPEVEKLALHGSEPGRDVHNNRKERHQKGDEDLGQEAIAEPDQKNGCDRHFGNELGDQQQRHDDIPHRWDDDDQGSRDYAGRHRKREAADRFVQRDPGVPKIEIALFVELRGDGTGRRHQVRRNLECPARDFPCDDEHDERQADFQNPDELRRDHLSHQVAGPGRRRSLGAPVETKACKGVPSLLWKALEQSYPSTNANYMFVFLTGTVKHGGVDQKSRVQDQATLTFRTQ